MTEKKHLKLFIASPNDVKVYRDAAEAVVKDLNNEPVYNNIHIETIRWEDHDTPGVGRPQQVIFDNTDFFTDTDIFVGILWSKIGSPSGIINPETREPYTGTLEEIDAALELVDSGRIALQRFMLYFCSKELPEDRSEQSKEVNEFRENIEKKKTAHIKEFDTVNDFKYKFKHDLTMALRDFLVPPALSSSVSPSGKSNVGPHVHKNCDRIEQYNNFREFFHRNFRERPKLPQFYFIHGTEGECHESFVDRLMKTSLKKFSERISGEEYASMYPPTFVNWPQQGKIEERKKQLTHTLFQSFDNEENYDWEGGFQPRVLYQLPCLSKQQLVIIKHNIYATKWDIHNLKLLSWYIKEYWAQLEITDEIPQFLIFLIIIYPRKQRIRRLNRLIKFISMNKSRITKQLDQISVSGNKFCPCGLINELESVTIEDVKDWFSANIDEDEATINTKIDDFFQDNNQPVNSKPMADTEKFLEGVVKEHQGKEF